ncbi:MAG TPA: LysR family transcriptional regulator [Candidatus Acidoferrales bacterium]|nr:LysR family transcriptional regulator [Candidatus Acidoferrales bacterium]
MLLACRGSTTLYITPSGLSVSIRELETQLGFRLSDRTTRHVGLTSSGSELLGAVRESLEKLDAAVSRAVGGPNPALPYPSVRHHGSRLT